MQGSLVEPNNTAKTITIEDLALLLTVNKKMLYKNESRVKTMVQCCKDSEGGQLKNFNQSERSLEDAGAHLSGDAR